MTPAAVVCAGFAGLGGAVQVAIMGRFGSRVGVVEALTFATFVQLVCCAAVLLLVKQGVGNLGGAASAPRWMWLSGVLGLFIIFAITFAQPHIGAGSTIGLLITGQLAMGAAIDRYGLLGADPIHLTPTRIAGLTLLGIGAALSLVR